MPSAADIADTNTLAQTFKSEHGNYSKRFQLSEPRFSQDLFDCRDFYNPANH